MWPCKSFDDSGLICLLTVVSAIWIVPFTALIFSLEAVLRNQSRTYAQRCQKWRVFVCVTLVLTLLLVTWVISRSSPTFDKCFGTLAWWAADYGVLGVMIVSGLLVILPVIAVVLFFQLSHNAKIQSDEHLAGRKMICYLILTTALWVSGLVLAWCECRT